MASRSEQYTDGGCCGKEVRMFHVKHGPLVGCLFHVKHARSGHLAPPFDDLNDQIMEVGWRNSGNSTCLSQ